jgi:hypothetical protein
VEIKLTKNVFISLQPSYIQKGTRIAFEVEGQKERVDSVEVNLDYFSVPILVKVSTRNERYYVLGGLEFGYLIKAQHITSTEENDIKDDLDDYDVAVQFGAGYAHPLRRSRIFIEARYVQSVKNVISDEPVDDAALGVRLKNTGWIFCAGIMFGL